MPENEPTGVNGPLRLASLTSLRFYAALGVVALHSVPILVSPHLLALVDAGQAGVDFFFVLSGFVLTYAARSMSGAVFYWNRFAVWPLHAVMWALALTTFWWLGQSPRGGPAVSTLFLGQAWVDDPTY